MSLRQLVVATGVVLAALVTGAIVIQAPLYRRYSAEECIAAYRRADTRADTARTDLHPYADSIDSSVRRRCGEVRARLVSSAAEILPR